MAQLRFRIDMRLTDDHILQTITQLIAQGDEHITLEKIAECSKCGLQTAVRSTRRLKQSGRLVMVGGRGRRPISYKVIECES